MGRKLFLILIVFEASLRFYSGCDSVSSVLEKTIHFLLNLENSAKIPDSICKTWIFTLDTKCQYEFEQKSSDLLYRDRKWNPYVILSIESDTVKNHTSYFNREYEDRDMFFPTALGYFHHIRFCSIVILPTLTLDLKVFDLLFAQKLARPHMDYFFRIGSRSTVEDFLYLDPLTQDIRFKFGLIGKPDSSIFEFQNGCFDDIDPDPAVKIFSTNCPKIINEKTLRVSANIVHEKMRYETYENGSLIEGKGHGVFLQILLESAKHYNFSFTIKATSAGIKLSNGSWQGALGDVFNRKSDLDIGTVLCVGRNRVVDWTSTLDRYTRVFYIRTPPLVVSWQAIFRPLMGSVWLAIAAALTLLTPVMFLTVTLRSRHSDFTLTDFAAVWAILMKTLLEQSARLTAKGWTGPRARGLFALWGIFGLVIGTGYRSKLANFLTFVEPDQIPPLTHRDLALSDYTLYFRYYGGAAYGYIAASKDPIHQKLLPRLLLLNTSAECIVAATMTERSACMDYSNSGDFAISNNASLYTFSKHKIFLRSLDQDLSVAMGWAFRKGSPLTAPFDKMILFCMASGLHDHWQFEDWTNSRRIASKYMRSDANSAPIKKKIQEIYKAMDTVAKPLSVKSFYGLFCLLCIGLCGAAVSFVAEILTRCRKMRIGRNIVECFAKIRDFIF